MGQLKEEIQAAIAKMSPPNIAIIGRTGSGKSTLINTVFGEDLAKAGTGLPISDAFVRYPKSVEEQSLVVIYDSAGYEMGKEALFRRNVVEFLQEKKKLNLEQQIHLVWYVVHAGMKRLEHFDAEIIQVLKSEMVPFIVVLSQADLARPSELAKMEEAIKDYRGVFEIGDPKILQVAADPMNGDIFGVSQLVKESSDLLPHLYAEALIARQVFDLKLKKKLAHNYTKLSAATCFATGFIPLPGTTPATTMATQTVLCGKIAALYGHAEWVEILDTAGTFTINSMLTVGVTWVLDLFSTIIPPLTGALAGGIAATYITVIGRTYASVFEKLSLKQLNGETRAEIEAFIKDTFREEFKKNSKIKITSKDDLDKLDLI